jgi:arylsulfatase A-like enzyme
MSIRKSRAAMITRRQLTAGLAGALAHGAQPAAPQPNILYFILDDLGLYDLGCFGSKEIATPNIDHLAAEGMKFTEAYSGCTVCAPARATIMTGKHMGHSSLRANPGGVSLQAPDFTLAQMLKKAG